MENKKHKKSVCSHCGKKLQYPAVSGYCSKSCAEIELNTKRTPAFIKIKHTINTCDNERQLKGAFNLLQNHKDQREFMVLFAYYQAKEKELQIDDIVTTETDYSPF